MSVLNGFEAGLYLQLQCKNSVGWSVFSDQAPLLAHTHTHNCIHLFYCIRALCKYVHCQSLEGECADWAEKSILRGAI